ncbi:hypothetical protein M9435_005262 [Picochlorum sp. BPE23]|nr:hypothetical protein M9435_005262 [Picochlorum sp. BPE23]
MSGPGTSRVGQCMVGGTYVSAKVGPWSSYDLLEVLYRDPSTYVDGEEQTQQTKVYATGDWSRWQDSVANGSLDLSDLLDMSELYGRGSTKLSDDMLRVDRIRPAEGSHVVFVPAPQEDSVTLCDVWVCAIQRDFDGRGEPITPRGVSILASKISGITGRSRTDLGDSCNDSQCGDGRICTGTYTPLDCGATCNVLDFNVKCAPMDVEIGRKHDCGKDAWYKELVLGLAGYCDPRGAPICAKCDECKRTFVGADVVGDPQLPQSAQKIATGGSTASSTTMVENCSPSEQTVSVTFAFDQTQSTTVDFTKKDSSSLKKGLDLKIPFIGAGLGVESTQKRTITDGETVEQSGTSSFSAKIDIKVPANTKQRVTGNIKTSTVQMKFPVRYILRYSCGETEEETDDITMTTNGVLAGTSSDVQVEYGEQVKC